MAQGWAVTDPATAQFGRFQPSQPRVDWVAQGVHQTVGKVLAQEPQGAASYQRRLGLGTTPLHRPGSDVRRLSMARHPLSAAHHNAVQRRDGWIHSARYIHPERRAALQASYSRYRSDSCKIDNVPSPAPLWNIQSVS